MQSVDVLPISVNDSGPVALFNDRQSGYTSKAAVTPADIELVISVRRQAYARAGLALPSAVISDVFDTAANTRSYLLFRGALAVGTVRTSFRTVDGWPDLETPFSSHFRHEIDVAVGGSNFVEVSRLAVITTSRSQFRPLFLLMQSVTTDADHIGCRYILAPSRSDHIGFYQHLGFKSIGEPKAYHHWPMTCQLLVLDWWAERDPIRRRQALYLQTFSDRSIQAVI
jgi:hypothetical protein